MGTLSKGNTLDNSSLATIKINNTTTLEDRSDFLDTGTVVKKIVSPLSGNAAYSKGTIVEIKKLDSKSPQLKINTPSEQNFRKVMPQSVIEITKHLSPTPIEISQNKVVNISSQTSLSELRRSLMNINLEYQKEKCELDKRYDVKRQVISKLIEEREHVDMGKQ
jgi:hypothetical protein